MIDAMTKQAIRVLDGGEGGPLLKLPFDQLGQIREVLDRAGIKYWSDPSAISFDGKPYIIYLNFGRSGDLTRIQEVIDAQA